MATVEAWGEILWGQVPVESLNDAYMLTMRSRKSTWPLTVSEICATYYESQRPSFMAPEKSIQW